VTLIVGYSVSGIKSTGIRMNAMAPSSVATKQAIRTVTGL
jgi:hypothetical protein